MEDQVSAFEKREMKCLIMRLKVITHVCSHMVKQEVVSHTRSLVTERTLELYQWFAKKCFDESIKRNKTHQKTSDLKSLFPCLRFTMNVFKIYCFPHPDDQREGYKFERVNLMVFMLKGYVTSQSHHMKTSNSKFLMVLQIGH